MPRRFCRPLVGKKLDHWFIPKTLRHCDGERRSFVQRREPDTSLRKKGRKHDEAAERVLLLFVLPDKFSVAICGRHKQWQWQFCRLVHPLWWLYMGAGPALLITSSIQNGSERLNRSVWTRRLRYKVPQQKYTAEWCELCKIRIPSWNLFSVFGCWHDHHYWSAYLL